MKKFNLLLFFCLFIAQSIFAQGNCCTDFDATATPSSICIGQSTQLNAIGDGCGEFAEFTWVSVGFINNPNSPNPIVSPTQTTTYFLMYSSESCNSQVVDLVTVVVNDFVTPTFNIGANYCESETPDLLNNMSLNGVGGVWFPSQINSSNIGTTQYTFTPFQGQCATIFQINVTIEEEATPVFNFQTTYCVSDTPDNLPTISSNGVKGDWDPVSISTDNPGNTQYTFTPKNNECAVPIEIIVVVSAPVEPTFSLEVNYCTGDNPNQLPTNSLNGISGTWNPAGIATTTSGTTSYTFTPSNSECAEIISVDVVIEEMATPTFDFETNYCQEDSPDQLPPNSINGISGTWNPAGIATTSSGSTSYTFTPSNSECAEIISVDVVIEEMATPTFDFETNYCQEDSPDQLPSNSINGISGTWSPASITTVNGGTTQFTFTPLSDECASAISVDVVIEQMATPTFDFETNYCQEDSPNQLPSNSINGISGTWSPTTINTVNAGTTAYTFTPSSNECAEALSLDILIEEMAAPAFNFETNYCQEDIPEQLPASSVNGISGTWSPETINTVNGGTTQYTFTPLSSECASEFAVDVVIETSDVPTFNFATEYCLGDLAELLPGTSINGVTGSWNPDVISTSNAGSANYTFSPDSDLCATNEIISITTTQCACANPPTADAGADQVVCVDNVVNLEGDIGGAASIATWSTLGSGTFDEPTNLNAIYTPSNADISTGSVSVILTTDDPDGNGPCTATSDEIQITIDQISADAGPNASICFGEVFQLCANEEIGATYEWSTGETSRCIQVNPIETSVFVVDVIRGNCFETDDVVVTVEEVVTPTFNFETNYCQEDIPDQLPPNSINGINGIWSPEIISTVNEGTTQFTFTPLSDQCVSEFTIDVVVATSDIPTFNFTTEYCLGDQAELLPGTSINGVTGSWNPDVISTSNAGSSNYTFTPDSDLCATTEIISITITQCACANPPSAQAGADQAVCADNVVNLAGTIGGTANTATWSTLGSGTFDEPTNLNAIYTPSNADISTGSVSIVLTTDDPDGNGPCAATSDEIQIIIDQISADAGPNASICFGEVFQLCANQENGATYEWSTGETSRCIQVNPIETTVFVVDVNLGNCSETDDVMITVFDELIIILEDGNTPIISGGTPPYQDTTITSNGNFITATVTDANGCMASDSFLTTALIEHQNEKIINVYPNPTYDRVYVEYLKKSTEDYQIKIISSDGRIVKSMIGHPAFISIQDLEQGLYYLRMKNESGSSSMPLIKLN